MTTTRRGKSSQKDCHAYFLQKIHRAGSARQAVFISFDEMKALHVKPSLGHFKATLIICARHKQWKTALALLEEMQQQQRHYHAQPDVMTYNIVLKACAKAGQWQKAQNLLDEMENHYHHYYVVLRPTVVSYSTVWVACQAGR